MSLAKMPIHMTASRGNKTPRAELSVFGKQAKTTNVYWQPLEALLHPKQASTQALPGFDIEFVDIVDYIIRITHRIWEQKNIGLCMDYYAKYCPVHTLGGYCDAVEVVIQNTLKTIAAFPDRSLIGENVVWSQDEDTFYSSHRITSIMTNKGASEFGAATGKTGRVTTIADCVCKQNRIVYEWLMRDNSFLVKQLGIEPLQAARHQAKAPVAPEFVEWINAEFKRVWQLQPMVEACPELIDPACFDFAHAWVEQLFNQKNFHCLADFYHLNAQVQWPGGRRSVGIPGVLGIITQWLAQCANANATLDHIALTPFDNDTLDIAIRWSLAGTFNAQTPELMPFTGQHYFVLAASHFRLFKGKIIKEWTVFDEIASMANLVRNLPHEKVLNKSEIAVLADEHQA